MRSVLILGGYGNFGKRIARALTLDGIQVTIAGRNRKKAEKLAADLPDGLTRVAVFDVYQALDQQLKSLKPGVVVNTCGPFQSSDYSVAECCIRNGVHYIDLADGREFVPGIAALDADARAADVTVISGASTVPGLSSAVLERFRPEFSVIDEIQYGISPGQQAERGLATTQGILSYVGKQLKQFPTNRGQVFGWQGLYRQEYPGLGKRWMANCDIPDLDLLPERYGVRTIQFSAGLELGLLHVGLWGLSWLVRIGVPLNLPRFSQQMLWASDLFDRFGSADGGMHVILRGKGLDGQPHIRRWFIIAKGGDGPQIPTIPAVALAKDLVRGVAVPAGAMPCVGLVNLDRYWAELGGFAVEQFVF